MKIFYKMLCLLNSLTGNLIRKLEEKAERDAKEIEKAISYTQECKSCYYGKYIRSDCVLECGYICYLNKLNPMSLGLMANNSFYK